MCLFVFNHPRNELCCQIATSAKMILIHYFSFYANCVICSEVSKANTQTLGINYLPYFGVNIISTSALYLIFAKRVCYSNATCAFLAIKEACWKSVSTGKPRTHVITILLVITTCELATICIEIGRWENN